MGGQARRPRFDPPLRWAVRDDARSLARLINIAGEGIPAYLWSLSAKAGQDPLEVGAQRAAHGRTGYSYSNALVAEVSGEVVALLLGYRLPEAGEPEALPEMEMVRPFAELEGLVPGSFYINALATLAEHRRCGLGSRLLEAADAVAAALGSRLITVEAFEQNTGALRLYERHGYRFLDRRPCVPHPCHPYDGDVLLLARPVRDGPARDGPVRDA